MSGLAFGDAARCLDSVEPPVLHKTREWLVKQGTDGVCTSMSGSHGLAMHVSITKASCASSNTQYSFEPYNRWMV